MTPAADPFRDEDGGVLIFRPAVEPQDRAWWERTFGQTTPRSLAERLASGLPGNKTFTYSIDGQLNRFALDTDGREGNAVIWYSSSVLEMREAHFYEDGIQIDEKRRGAGLVQLLLGNIADLADEIAIPRISLHAENIGGYSWARAGAVPVGETMFLRDDLLRRMDRIAVRRELTSERFGVAVELIQGLRKEPRAIWAIAALSDVVTSAHMRDINGPKSMTLGRELLIGTRWHGSIDLLDPISRATFDQWRNRWDDSRKSAERSRGGPTSETSGPGSR